MMSKKVQQTEKIHIIAVGDTMLGGASQEVLDKYGYDYPFKSVQSFFKKKDLVLVNLEAPITTHHIKLAENKTYTYKVKPKSITGLKSIGTDIVNLANNHSLDFGIKGLMDTIETVTLNGILPIGAGKNSDEVYKGQIVEIHGVKIGFLAFMHPYHIYETSYKYFSTRKWAGVGMMKAGNVKKFIRKIKKRCHFVVVSFHWGHDYKRITAKQIEFGRYAVKKGADIVIGHHPHVIQGFEVFNGKPILYSLGNFAFGTEGSFEKVEALRHYGLIADICIDHGSIAHLDLIPIETNNLHVQYQPKPVGGKEIIGAIFENVSKNFRTQYHILNDRVRIQQMR